MVVHLSYERLSYFLTFWTLKVLFFFAISVVLGNGRLSYIILKLADFGRKITDSGPEVVQIISITTFCRLFSMQILQKIHKYIINPILIFGCSRLLFFIGLKI